MMNPGLIKAFHFNLELLVVVAIKVLSSVGVVAYNGYTKNAKSKTSELNYTNINKALMFEFMKCELDSRKQFLIIINAPIQILRLLVLSSGFITNNLKMSNPYGSNLINKSPCTQGSISISSTSKGNYSVSFYSAPQKKKLLLQI